MTSEKKITVKKKTKPAVRKSTEKIVPVPVPKKKKPTAVAAPLTDAPFINRDLSWLEFNSRVLAIAADESMPLLERLKFLAITASNLDEFAMVRVGSLHVLVRNEHGQDRELSGMTMETLLDKIRDRLRCFMQDQYAVLESLEPLLKQHGIRRYHTGETLPLTAIPELKRYTENELLPVLTPMPLNREEIPILKNLGLYILVRLARPEGENDLWILPLWQTARFVRIDDTTAEYAYIAVEDVVRRNLESWFPGQTVLEATVFRLTRNADFSVRENELPDLMLGMEEVLSKRQTGFPVRFEVDRAMNQETLSDLMTLFHADPADLIPVSSILDLSAFSRIAFMRGFDNLKDPAWEIYMPPAFPQGQSIFPVIAKQDQLLLLPYESFDPVVRLVDEAADDPNVLAIKQILYRSGSESRIIDALIRAAVNGKSVTVIVELKARFDEARNIDWARKLERYGVQVIYGIRNYKTHAKICMVVRRESQGIVRYLHLGTGNYNASTAKIYSDIGLFTADPAFGEDAACFFNTVCGVSTPMPMNKLSMAPLYLREHLQFIIDKAITAAASGQKVKLSIKLNSLCDGPIIKRLYDASRAGVKIRLNIRGICMLKPEQKGWSENIRVVSIVDRFLEHARIISLQIAGTEQLWISSADWMPRNLNRRIELLVPVEDPLCMKKLTAHLETFFKDNTNAWGLNSSGLWTRLTASGKPSFRAQQENQRMIGQAVSLSEKRKTVTFEPHRKILPDKV